MAVFLRIAVLALAPLMVSASAATDRDHRPVRIEITPQAMSESTGHSFVDVLVSIPNAQSPADEPLLTGIAAQLPDQGAGRMVVTDAQGEVPRGRAEVEKASEGYGDDDGPAWVPARAVTGDLSVRYRLPVENLPGNSGIPPLGPRIDGRAFSSAGQAFLVFPAPGLSRAVELRWNLSKMGSGATAVSSFGDGDVDIIPPSTRFLERALFMAGQLQRDPAAIQKSGFSAAWSGDPGFDLHPVMDWTHRLYDRMNIVFGSYDSPYHVLLRYNSRNPGGGVAARDSFMVTYGTGVTGDGLKRIMGHEMTHTFTAFDMGIWFDEGNAVYYQTLLPWRAGMIATDARLDDINKTASRYYTNPKIDTPESQLAPNFWRDTWLNTLGYDRGALYFAVLDGKIRRASRGRMSIDDLMREMVRRFRGGQPVGQAVWLDLLRGAIGEDGVKVHQQMMAGGTMVPESGDYGPCFRRIVKPVRRYELGFTARAAADGSKIVADLIAGSEAEKSGVRDGDRIVLPIITTEGVRRNPEASLTVQITRDGHSFPITYLPRGTAIDVYQWERVPGVPDNSCRA